MRESFKEETVRDIPLIDARAMTRELVQAGEEVLTSHGIALEAVSREMPLGLRSQQHDALIRLRRAVEWWCKKLEIEAKEMAK